MNLDKKDVGEEKTKTVIINHDYRNLIPILLIVIAGVLGFSGVQGWGWFLFVAVLML